MLIFSRVHLAWFNLTHDKVRLLVRVLGVAFAVFLMFVELGFWNALLDASVELIRQFNGQLIVVSKAHYALAIKEPFTTRRLAQARQAPGVQAAYAVYLEYTASYWKDTGVADSKRSSSHPIRVIAFDPEQPVLNNAEVNAHRADLKILDNVLLDRKSKRAYGARKREIDRELSRHMVHVASTFQLGTDFASDGSVIMSDLTYAHLFANELTPTDPLSLADVGVIRIEPGADVETVRRAVRGKLLDDVNVYTKDEFIDLEKTYWRKATPIGFIFRFGLFMGFIVGAVICYQIISTDVSEHLPEYATLKAIGYHDLYLSGVVLREALWLAVLGFVPGLGLSWLLYRLLDMWIGLPMKMNHVGILLIFSLTTVMCVVSGLLALRKVKTADPAEVFA
ncbi:MAG TPA: ABC transporter permease DevC [Gemmataceae bacterium]|nr:ABC transporter permease DevC [Gemmataceae bacterium]